MYDRVAVSRQPEVMNTLQASVTLTVEEVQTLVFRLPPLEFVWLADRMIERAETFGMMCLAETGFAEWNEPGENIYDHPLRENGIPRVRIISISRYVQAALEQAEYEQDENGVVIARVPGASGFFSQGETFEEARDNLRDAIEGNLTLALQLGLSVNEVGITREEWIEL